jgi:glycosyltransferase involved in cell wall biosynthesis
MKASVILSTYNSTEWLEKVLVGFSAQTEKDFELIIADDGSGDETRLLIEQYQKTLPFPVVHVWQEDVGFQKSRILNKAIVASQSDYLIFTDGDCIPRKDFVEIHLAKRDKNCFLSGGYFKLSRTVSEAITLQNIVNQDCFSMNWLQSKGLKKSIKSIKITSKGIFSDLMNWVTPTKATWNGHNSSGWKTDIVKVNGFNEDMQYGGLDRELGERLFNAGLRSKQIRYSAICIHLDHERKYMTEASVKKNLQIRKNTIKNKVVVTPNGIVKG